MQHLDEGTIHAWLDGALASEESARVEQHTRHCAECSAMVADARGLIAGASRIVSALDNVPSGVIPKTKTPAPAASGSLWRTLHLTPFRAALAASLMVAVGSLFAVRGSDSRAREMVSLADTQVVSGRSAAAPAAPPARARVEMSPAPAPRVTSRADAVAGAASPAVVEKAKVAADAVTSPPMDTSRRVAEVARDSVSRARESGVRAGAEPAAAPPKALADQRVQRVVSDTARAQVAQAPAPMTGASATAARGAAGGLATDQAMRRAAATDFRTTNTSLGFASSDAFAGCYRVNTDSANWPRPLPLRFSLETDTTSTARQRNVRELNAAGRVDTAVAGSWRDVAPGIVLVTLSNRDRQTQFSLTQAAGVTMAQRLDVPVRTIPVVRETCRP